jgi:hypothetical protein
MSGPAIPASLGLRQAVPLASLAAQAAGDVERLVSELFPQPAEAREALEQMRLASLAEMQAISRVASSDDGKVMLEWLLDQTLRRPVYIGRLGFDAMQAFGEGRFREGKNAIVHQLLVAIAIGRGEQPPFREGT